MADQIKTRRQKLHHDNNMRQAGGMIKNLEAENERLRRELKSLQEHYTLENTGWVAFAASVLAHFEALREGRRTMKEVDQNFPDYFAARLAERIPNVEDRKEIRKYVYGSTKEGEEFLKLIFD